MVGRAARARGAWPSATTSAERAATLAPERRAYRWSSSVSRSTTIRTGEGEFALTARVYEIVEDARLTSIPDVPDYFPGCTRILAEGTYESSVTDGTVLTPNRAVPASGDVIGDPSVGAAYGIPLFANRRYGWGTSAVEKDPALDDGMGHLGGRLVMENGWGPLGRTFSERGTVGWSSFFPPGFGFKPVYYSVDYEFRPVPCRTCVPLASRSTTCRGPPTSSSAWRCRTPGVLDAGPFETALHVDGVIPPNGRAQAGGLRAPGSASCASRRRCRRPASTDWRRWSTSRGASSSKTSPTSGSSSRMLPVGSHRATVRVAPVGEGVGVATDTESDSDADPRPWLVSVRLDRAAYRAGSCRAILPTTRRQGVRADRPGRALSVLRAAPGRARGFA